jgi:hypothetical protein
MKTLECQSQTKFQQKPETCAGLDDKNITSFQKGQRICDRWMKTTANLPANFQNEALFS